MGTQETGRPAVLAEGQWLWRRLYVFAVSAGLWRLLDRALTLSSPERRTHLADGVVTLLALILVIYLIAPTAQQIITLAATVRLKLGEGGRA